MLLKCFDLSELNYYMIKINLSIDSCIFEGN